MNAGLSVSRVGSAAQTKAMKGVAGRLRLDLAQYRELATFAQFGTSDLDAATRGQLERGQRAVEVLKQVQDAPLSLSHQIVILFALTNGLLDDIEIGKIKDFETELQNYLDANNSDLLKSIEDQKAISEEINGELVEAVNNFKSTVPY